MTPATTGFPAFRAAIEDVAARLGGSEHVRLCVAEEFHRRLGKTIARRIEAKPYTTPHWTLAIDQDLDRAAGAGALTFATRRNPGPMLAQAPWGGATIAVYEREIYLEGGGAHLLLAHNFEESSVYARTDKWMISLTDDGKKISKGDTYSSGPSTHAKSAGAAYESMRRMVEREFNVGLVNVDHSVAA